MEKSSRVLLVVDDDEGPRQSLDLVFRDYYETLLAASGEEAIRIASSRKIDTAIVDIRMPGMSGVETLGKLKEIDPAIEVVVLTAFETLDTARKALRLGAFDYLSKPFDISAIRASIAHAMERRDVSEGILASDRELDGLRQSIYDHKMGEQMARTKGEIYASVIHDINGPMTVISGFIDIINYNVNQVRRLDGANLEELKSHLAQITRQVDACIPRPRIISLSASH
jgi:DNA-binding NtrC family response regulator